MMVMRCSIRAIQPIEIVFISDLNATSSMSFLPLPSVRSQTYIEGHIIVCQNGKTNVFLDCCLGPQVNHVKSGTAQITPHMAFKHGREVQVHRPIQLGFTGS